MPKPKQIDGIRHAVMYAGSQKKLALKLGVSHSAVNKWVKQGYVPDERVDQLHEIYGIARARLCNPAYLEWAADNESNND